MADGEDLIPEPPVETPAEPERVWTEDDETEARAFGWKPSTEWKGERPAGHIESPVEWMDRVKRSKTFAEMQSRLERQDMEAQETARRLNAMNETALRIQRDNFERQLTDLTAQQRAAVEVADAEAFDRIERQKRQLTVPQPAVAAPTEVAEYQRQNEWTQNPLLWQEAIQAVNLGLQAGAVSDVASQIAYADRLMRQKYPHLFQKPEAPKPVTRPAAVDPGGLAARPASNGFNALPQEARAAFARFAREGLYPDTEQGRRDFMEIYNAV